MHILITGGAGFIGGHLAERCLEAGHDVVSLDSMHPYYDVGLKRKTVDICRNAADGDGTGAFRFIEGDVRDDELVDSVVSEADLVYHQAGRAGVRDSVEQPRIYDEVNVDGTLTLLDAAREAELDRVVLASSSSVYGRPEYLPYDESHPTTPVSPYGASKLAAERYGCAYDAVYDLPVVALRYFTVYGPRMRPNMAISNFVSRCLNGKPPVVYGDGTQTRDFTYIDDIVAANMALLETDAADGEAVNIGSTDTIEIGALATEVREATDAQVDIEQAPRHGADAEHTHAAVQKAARLLDYDPSYSIPDGVRSFIDWYRSNRDWYEPLVLAS